MTGTRDGVPLCNQVLTKHGATCVNTVWRNGKCAVHWTPDAVELANCTIDPPAPAEPERPRYSGGSRVYPPPTGWDAVMATCRRWDRLYDATLHR